MKCMWSSGKGIKLWAFQRCFCQSFHCQHVPAPTNWLEMNPIVTKLIKINKQTEHYSDCRANKGLPDLMLHLCSHANNKSSNCSLAEPNVMHVTEAVACQLLHYTFFFFFFLPCSNTSSRVSRGLAGTGRHAHITPSLITEAGFGPWEK